MDSQAIVQALSRTLFPEQREQAETLLEEVSYPSSVWFYVIK